MNCHPTLCGMLVDVEDGAARRRRAAIPTIPTAAASSACAARPRARSSATRARLLPPLRARPARRAVAARRRWDEALDLIVDAHARGRARGGRALVGARALREQLRHARRHSQPAPPLRQPLGLPVVEPDDDLLGARRLRPRRSPASLETNTKEDMGAHADAHRPVGRQPREPAEHRRATSRRRAAAARTSSRSTCGETEAAAQSDEVLIVRPGTDAALALGDDARDRRGGPRTIARSSTRHTVGFDALAAHVRALLARRGPRASPASRPSGIVGARPPLRDDAAGHDRARRQLACTRARTAGRARARSAACPRSPATSASPAAASARATAARSHGQA